MPQYSEARDPFSFFRTVTVGPGLAPDLRFSLENAPAGCPVCGVHRRWGLAPRPESYLCFNGPASEVKSRRKSFRLSPGCGHAAKDSRLCAASSFPFGIARPARARLTESSCHEAKKAL